MKLHKQQLNVNKDIQITVTQELFQELFDRRFWPLTFHKRQQCCCSLHLLAVPIKTHYYNDYAYIYIYIYNTDTIHGVLGGGQE